jgi:hypothetical protein
MGDRVDVKVLYANPVNRQIDLLPGAAEMPEPSPEVQEVAAGLSAPKPSKLKAPRDAATDADAPSTQRALPGRSRRTSGARGAAAGAGERSDRRRKARGERPAAGAAAAAAAPAATAAAAPAASGRRKAAGAAPVAPATVARLARAVDALPASHVVTPRPRPAADAPRRRLRFASVAERP